MKINIQKNIYKIMMAVMAAFVAVVSVLPACTYADDSTAILVQDGYMKHASGDPHILGYYQGNLTLEETQKYMCFYCWGMDGDYMKLQAIYDQQYIDWNKDFRHTISYEDHDTTSGNLCINNYKGSLKYYIFNSEEEANAYLKTGDASKAINQGDLIEDKGDYDESLPYYDKAEVTPIASNNMRMQFSAAMNSRRVKDLYNLRDDGYQLYYTFESYGVYMDSDLWTSLIGIFDQYGLTTSFSKKVKENITIDSSGRLVVGKAHSGGGGRHSGTLFKTKSSNTCHVYAVEMKDTVTTFDKLSASQNFDKELSASIYNGGNVNNLLLGVNGSAKLIGYYAIIQPYIIKDGTIVYAKPTYAYNWCYKSLRDALGSGAYNYDPTTPDGPVDPVTPPSPGPSPDPDDPEPDPVDPSSFDLVEYLKLCMTEAKSFILLFNMYLTAVPAAIWVLIITAMTLNLFIIVFKIVRGM